jgi:hypothetical protein
MGNDNGAKSPTVKEPVLLVRAIFGIVLGGMAGFAMHRYVGCPNGTCLITASPWGSVAYWMILGFVVSQIRFAKKDRPDDGGNKQNR